MGSILAMAGMCFRFNFSVDSTECAIILDVMCHLDNLTFCDTAFAYLLHVYFSVPNCKIYN